MYCSAESQKVNWTEGGHKKQCKARAVKASVEGNSKPRAKPVASIDERLSAAVSSLASSTASASGVMGGASRDDECCICYDSDPLDLLPGGCACRGSARLAHVACRTSAAETKHELTRNPEAWTACATCNQVTNIEAKPQANIELCALDMCGLHTVSCARHAAALFTTS